MATMITDECINCGACEPECPNTAIYQGGVEWDALEGGKRPALSDQIFYIVPEKCTECVGFYDHEACAAVCPVDCCVPNPSIPESETVLIARAKQIHPDKEFGSVFPSRFSGGAGEAPADATPGGETAAAAPAPAAPAAPVAVASAPPAVSPEDALAAAVPDLEDWDVPLKCFRCSGQFSVPFQYVRPGMVLHCPHCVGSYVPNSALYQALSRRLTRFHAAWTKSFDEFRERRARELESFEATQKATLATLDEDLKRIAEDSEIAGAPARSRGFFG